MLEHFLVMNISICIPMQLHLALVRRCLEKNPYSSLMSKFSSAHGKICGTDYSLGILLLFLQIQMINPSGCVASLLPMTKKVGKVEVTPRWTQRISGIYFYSIQVHVQMTQCIFKAMLFGTSLRHSGQLKLLHVAAMAPFSDVSKNVPPPI